MPIPQIRWFWRPRQRWLATLVTVAAMAVSTLVVECKSDGRVILEVEKGR